MTSLQHEFVTNGAFLYIIIAKNTYQFFVVPIKEVMANLACYFVSPSIINLLLRICYATNRKQATEE